VRITFTHHAKLDAYWGDRILQYHGQPQPGRPVGLSHAATYYSLARGLAQQY